MVTLFKPRNYFDQLCYETDLQELKDGKKIEKQLKNGLTLVLDYNEERQMNENALPKAKNDNSHDMEAFGNDDDNSFALYLDSISISFKYIIF